MTTIQTMNDVRRANLRKLVTKYEGMNGLARALGLGRGAYISQLLMQNPIRVISEKTARKWEAQLGLASGWLDSNPEEKKAPSTLDTALLSQTIEAVLDGLKGAKANLPAARVADLIAMQYADAVPTGQVDLARLNIILALLK